MNNAVVFTHNSLFRERTHKGLITQLERSFGVATVTSRLGEKTWYYQNWTFFNASERQLVQLCGVVVFININVNKKNRKRKPF